MDNPTKELCHKLDEMGVEYVSIGGITNWEHAEFDELADGSDTRLIVYGATPEQAIAATVGEEHEMHICKRCGVAYELDIIDKGFGKHRFCPNCGYREMHQ
jgi:hypothetical protein